MLIQVRKVTFIILSIAIYAYMTISKLWELKKIRIAWGRLYNIKSVNDVILKCILIL